MNPPTPPGPRITIERMRAKAARSRGRPPRRLPRLSLRTRSAGTASGPGRKLHADSATAWRTVRFALAASSRGAPSDAGTPPAHPLW
jgi:hypothetical protein